MITITESYEMFGYGIGIGVLLTAAWLLLAIVIAWLYSFLK